MAIQIITNFNVNAPSPIDERTVVADIASRNAIEYKFAGLKTFVFSEGVTYVYGTDSVWRVDGGQSTNTGGNGIYGGSGSLPGDVSVFLGTVSNNFNDRSNYLYYETNGLSDGDKSNIYNYTFRRNTGSNWDTMAFRQEQKIIPFGESTRQGPFIEYNGVNPMDVNLVGSLNIGVGTSPTPTDRVTRVSVTNLATEFYSTQNPILNIEPPISITKISADSTLGYNTKEDGGYYDSPQPSYRIRFGDGVNNLSEWKFDTRIIDSETWNTVMRIDAESEPSQVTSNIRFLVDSSSRDWDGNSTRTPQLLSPQEIVRNIEHRYTKLQMWNVGTFKSIESETLYLRSEGNSYDVTLQPGQSIKNIKIEKTSTNRPDFPNGTIITIRFINADITRPGFLRIFDGKTETSNIKSEITDATFEGDDKTRLTINHLASPSGNGEVITFRKYNSFQLGVGIIQFWEIVNVNRARKIVTRNWPDASATEWSFYSAVRYFTQLSTSGQFESLGGVEMVTNPLVSLNHPPNKWFPNPQFSGLSRETINLDGFKFRISVDGNRIVFVQGNFQIYVKGDVRMITQTQNLRKLFLKNDGRPNIWLIGKINKVSLLPQWESSWTYVKGWIRATQTGLGVVKPVEISDAILSINRVGDIFLTFEANTTDTVFANLMQELFVEISVPPFSYTAATASFTQNTSG